MTPAQLELVRATVGEVEGRADCFAASFYARLFALAPEARALFPADMAAQRGKLVDGFSFLVAVMGDVGALVGRARALGALHHRMGVRPAHYDVVEAALLAALGDVLGPAWNQPTMLAWQRLYRLVAETMLEGAAGAALVGPRP